MVIPNTEATDGFPFIDTHAHLDEPVFDDDRAAVISAANGAGVSMIVNIGYRPERWSSSIALAKMYSQVVCTLGVHPQHASEWNSECRKRLIATIAESGAKAVGEIGLDYFRDTVDKAVQRRAFLDQIQVANDLGLPIVIHQRSAEIDCVAILREIPWTLAVVLHSFDGTNVLGDLARERGWILGVGGLMTRASSGVVRSIIADVPLDRLVLETDSPYLPPAGSKHRRNTPESIPVIAQRLADLKALALADVANATTRTAMRVFGPSVGDQIGSPASVPTTGATQ